MLRGTVEVTFLVLLIVVVFGPAIAERVGVPGIVGLIFGGTLFGPFVLDWLSQEGLVDELGAIGILYLMYLAGVGFDIPAFNANRRSALTYGLLGFTIPFFLTITVVLLISELGLLAASLLGAMWASNTLVAYPQVQAAGLQESRAVSASVSAGVVADLLSLTVLAVATATAVVETDPLGGKVSNVVTGLASGELAPTTEDPKLPLWLALPILVGFCLWVLPRLTEWFFVRVGRSRMQRFVFALVGMSAGATVALLGGVEGLIGAFLAGLGMNRLIPTAGPLMERLEFVGGAIFVPAFLVSIGLNIDPALLVDPETLLLGMLFTGFVVVGKLTAAAISGYIFKFTSLEVGLMASLSFGQAASTLAIAQVGLSLGMFSQTVVNASVIAIVITALLTSYGTRFFAKRVPPPVRDRPPLGALVMLDVRQRSSDIESLTRVAASIARADSGVVAPFVISDPGEADPGSATVAHAVAALSGHGHDADGIVRVDESFESGTVHLAEENDASMVLLSWDGPRFANDYLVGSDIDRTGERCPVPAMAARVIRGWQDVIVFLGSAPTPAQFDDSRLAIETATRLRRSDHRLRVITPDLDMLESLVDEDMHIETGITSIAEFERLESSDLVVAPAYVLHNMPPRTSWRVNQSLDDINIVVVAGPHRLSISKGVTREPLKATVRKHQLDRP